MQIIIRGTVSALVSLVFCQTRFCIFLAGKQSAAPNLNTTIYTKPDCVKITAPLNYSYFTNNPIAFNNVSCWTDFKLYMRHLLLPDSHEKMNRPAASYGVSDPGFFLQNAASSGVLNPWRNKPSNPCSTWLSPKCSNSAIIQTYVLVVKNFLLFSLQPCFLTD